ncbi:hypothetical protein CO660_20375 [Rhizobium sp. L9]|uniref:hypothetical protein n=1 Tax=Rhizobium TaxID=379 RepID=UPI000BE86176|nr:MULTISPECIES: hypothetical protein [Rhizobium]MBX5151709.1 hypothetical protein [Rhizobium lentis]PDT27716.1 hypothetical protein CO660_20375 [Rhizobium sp. L9]
MGLDGNLIQAALLCGALAMPVLAYGAERAAEEAFLARLSTEVVPRMQREYMRVRLPSLGIDIASYYARISLNRWYVEGIFEPDEDLVITAERMERWELSPFLPYYLEETEIPDCAAMLSSSCRWLPLTLTLSP